MFKTTVEDLQRWESQTQAEFEQEILDNTKFYTLYAASQVFGGNTTAGDVLRWIKIGYLRKGVLIKLKCSMYFGKVFVPAYAINQFLLSTCLEVCEL